MAFWSRSPDPTRGSKAAWSNFILGVTCLELAVPVLIDVLRSPKLRPFGYVAADTFYYLSVARNIIEHGSPSMDGIHPTNGFHPLWQVATTLVFGACKLVGGANYCVFALVLACLACMVGATWILGRVIERALGYLPAPFVLIPFGVYAVFALPYHRLADLDGYIAEGPYLGPHGWSGTPPLYGTLYSFVNGMESALVLLAFAVVARTMLRCGDEERTPRKGAAVGGALAFLCLARLDHGAFALFPLFLWVVDLFAGTARRRFSVAAILAFAVPMAAYVSVNLIYAGAALPQSGSYKSTFPLPSMYTISEVLELLRHPLSRHPVWRIFRHAPSLLSMFASLVYLASVVRVRVERSSLHLELRSFTTAFDAFLVKMTPGIWLLGAYDLLFVAANGIGEWYHPVATIYLSLTPLSLYAWLSRLRPPRVASAGPLSRRALVFAPFASVLAVLVGSALVVGGFVRYQIRPDYRTKFTRLYWEVAPQVRAALGETVPDLFEYDDGIVGFSLHAPTMSGSRLGLDHEAMAAANAGHLLALGVDRGFSAFTTSVYGQHSLTAQSSEEDATRWLQQTWREEDLSGFRASVLYGDDLLTIVRVTKRSN